MRDIYAFWVLDKKYTKRRIEGLAYAMGHSEEELRRTYDRRPQQKREPVEELMQEVFNEFVS